MTSDAPIYCDKQPGDGLKSINLQSCWREFVRIIKLLVIQCLLVFLLHLIGLL